MLWIFKNIAEPCSWSVEGVYLNDAERMAELAAVVYKPNNPDSGFDLLFHPAEFTRFREVITQCDFYGDFWWQKVSVGERCVVISHDMMNPLFIDLQYFPADQVEEAKRSGLFKLLDAKGFPI